MENFDNPEIVNVGTGTDISIRDLAVLIAGQVGYRGQIKWDTSKPDGMPVKCLDVSKLNRLGFQAKIDLMTGIKQTITEYRQLKVEGKLA
jgi:GDP-L-fucose synthase